MTTANQKKKTADLEQELDKALEATFPASDPLSIGNTGSDKPDRPADRRPANIDKKLVEKLAQDVAQKKGAA